MSVYVNVLRHAVGRLSDNTLDQRERVYAKARQTVLGKLQDLKIAPENAMRSDHLAKLEAAIALVEAEFSSSGDSSSPPAHRITPVVHQFGIVLTSQS